MADGKKVEKKGVGFYVGWIGAPTLVAGGAAAGIVAAIAQSNPILGVVSGVTISGLTYILLRRFVK